MASPSQHFIRVGDQLLPLPKGVTVAAWSRERTYWQNPRIRAFLGCIRLLGGVMESNYALLHCSPERLLEIWRKVREVSDLMLTQLAPLLDNPSPCPELEEARSTAESALTLLADSVLADLERFPTEISPDEMIEVRKLLCVSIGMIHAFLQDAFGQLMAADPRSHHDADYFLSKRFPQDVEEAEWLHATVDKLRVFLTDLDQDRQRQLTPAIDALRTEKSLPGPAAWRRTRSFLTRLQEELIPRIKEVLALRGIRFHEMEILDRYAVSFPSQLRVLVDLHEAGRAVVDAVKRSEALNSADPSHDLAAREQRVRDLMACHAVFARRLALLLREIDTGLSDLLAFVPLWLEGIERRRALLLARGSRSPSSDAAPTNPEPPPGAPRAANA